MKKLKLTLNKETIAKLDNEKMDSIKGGEGVTYDYTCPLTCMYDYTDACPSVTCPPSSAYSGQIPCRTYTNDAACWSRKCIN